MWKDFFYFSKSDRITLIVLSIFILGVVCTYIVRNGPLLSVTGNVDSVEQKTDSFSIYPHRTFRKVKRTPRDIWHCEDGEPIHLTKFNPNTADSVLLYKLGLYRWQIRNIFKYRAKNGVYRSSDAFSRLYGLSLEKFEQLRPYILLPDHLQKAEFIEKKDTFVRRRYQEKYAEPVVLDLNTCDTNQLKMIPGIASGFARMIVSYRERLGGFYSVGQLKDIEKLPEGLSAWFKVSGDEVRKLNLNTMSLQRLKSHPYLNFYKARIIIEHRKKHGLIRSVRDLRLYKEFDSDDLEKLSHYAEF